MQGVSLGDVLILIWMTALAYCFSRGVGLQIAVVNQSYNQESAQAFPQEPADPADWWKRGGKPPGHEDDEEPGQ